MLYPSNSAPADISSLLNAAVRAGRAVPPLWPLATSVAVNPFLGQAQENLRQAGARLARVASARITMPRQWYRRKISSGEISAADLREAWEAAPTSQRPTRFSDLTAAVSAEPLQAGALPTIADLAAEVSGIDWPGLAADRIGNWAAAFFDEGQSLWPAPRGNTAYAAWRAVASHDLTPEIAGLQGFCLHVSEAPENAAGLITRASSLLTLSATAAESYFHRLLMTLGGWAQYARFKLWQAELAGESDATLHDLLAIRLIWEEALFTRYGTEFADRWADTLDAHARPIAPDRDMAVDVILQEAAERAAQRKLAAVLNDSPAAGQSVHAAERPLMQAAFCIDVRSEVFRRALESIHPGIETLGFAGFFGLALAHKSFASEVSEDRLPVLLRPALASCSGGSEMAATDRSARLKARAKRAWGRFKVAAVSSFAFVEAAGPIYFFRLLRDALSLQLVGQVQEPAPQLVPLPDLDARVQTAASILRAMSLTRSFAPLVLLLGHGARVTNNPHGNALNCGACGGHSGEVNARLLASLLNDRAVRAGLAGRGIDIPADTLFLAGLHDTTSDQVTLYMQDHAAARRNPDVERAKGWLSMAGRIARTERATTLPRAANDKAILKRGRNWSEIRPEWGLASCSAFIAAPRSRTAGRSLGGRAFLHEYDWRQDTDFGTLELILTAPVVVASWISLQYYGSTVAPQIFGAGNKLLHNVTGGMGVTEGNGGLLRAGLPIQSVHDGKDYVHEPLRLSVCIEAPVKAITDVLARHQGLRDLTDNGWLTLFALDDSGRIAWRYAGALNWIAMDRAAQPEQPDVKAPAEVA